MTDWDWVMPSGERRTPEQLRVHESLLAWDIRDGEDIVVIGGYSGDECAMLMERYPTARIWTWEPQLPMAARLVDRFGERVEVFPYAIGTQVGTFPMIRAGLDMASFITGDYAQHGAEQPDSVGEMREWVGVMDSLGIREIALLHVNIEQYEYILIPYLAAVGELRRRVRQMVVQVHPFPGLESHPEALPLEHWGVSPFLRPLWHTDYGNWHAWAHAGRHPRDIEAELRAEGIL